MTMTYRKATTIELTEAYDRVRLYAGMVVRGFKDTVGGDQYAYVGGMNPVDDLRDAIDEVEGLLTIGAPIAGAEYHGLDTDRRVCFYEQDFYVLSNFSAFRLCVDEHTGLTFDTLEAAYHYYKFKIDGDDAFNESRLHIRSAVRRADSAHDAFKIAERNKDQRRPDWDAIKVDVMGRLLRFKVRQHEYVARKLLATGDRELVENSWRDDFWGWGPNGDGKNMLGRLWMEVRAELRQQRAA